jgi:hypothetical protein
MAFVLGLELRTSLQPMEAAQTHELGPRKQEDAVSQGM